MEPLSLCRKQSVLRTDKKMPPYGEMWNVRKCFLKRESNQGEKDYPRCGVGEEVGEHPSEV